MNDFYPAYLTIFQAHLDTVGMVRRIGKKLIYYALSKCACALMLF